MISVLFVCEHNSARSQMAEAYMNAMGRDLFIAESAGLEAGALNPYAVRAMREDGIDISGKSTRSIFEVRKAGKNYQYVITVCSKEAADRCPVFPGPHKKFLWSFEDPSTFTGRDDEILGRVRDVRDAIREKVRGFIEGIRAEQWERPTLKAGRTGQ
jgi:arsenate reductase